MKNYYRNMLIFWFLDIFLHPALYMIADTHSCITAWKLGLITNKYNFFNQDLKKHPFLLLRHQEKKNNLSNLFQLTNLIELTLYRKTQLTEKGSACSQEIGAPHDAGLNFSGNDSGTATIMKKTSSIATAEANATTRLSL